MAAVWSAMVRSSSRRGSGRRGSGRRGSGRAGDRIAKDRIGEGRADGRGTRRHTPGDDLVSGLVRAADEEGGLPEAQLVSLVCGLV
ncbi:hypothetical protein DKT74_23780, partial [Streptomyces sp. ZEA17I]